MFFIFSLRVIFDVSRPLSHQLRNRSKSVDPFRDLNDPRLVKSHLPLPSNTQTATIPSSLQSHSPNHLDTTITHLDPEYQSQSHTTPSVKPALLVYPLIQGETASCTMLTRSNRLPVTDLSFTFDSDSDEVAGVSSLQLPPSPPLIAHSHFGLNFNEPAPKFSLLDPAYDEVSPFTPCFDQAQDGELTLPFSQIARSQSPLFGATTKPLYVPQLDESFFRPDFDLSTFVEQDHAIEDSTSLNGGFISQSQTAFSSFTALPPLPSTFSSRIPTYPFDTFSEPRNNYTIYDADANLDSPTCPELDASPYIAGCPSDFTTSPLFNSDESASLPTPVYMDCAPLFPGLNLHDKVPLTPVVIKEEIKSEDTSCVEEAEYEEEYQPKPSRTRKRVPVGDGPRGTNGKRIFTGTRSVEYPKLPVDAPIQARYVRSSFLSFRSSAELTCFLLSRKYKTSSRTSLKPVPKAMARSVASLRGRSFSDTQSPSSLTTDNFLDESDLPADVVATVVAKRTQNTLSARLSRQRKAEHLRELEDMCENQAELIRSKDERIEWLEGELERYQNV